MNDKETILKDVIQDEEKYSNILSIMFDGVEDLIKKGKTERQACTFVVMDFLYSNDFEFTKEALRKITNELLDEWRKNERKYNEVY